MKGQTPRLLRVNRYELEYMRERQREMESMEFAEATAAELGRRWVEGSRSREACPPHALHGGTLHRGAG